MQTPIRAILFDFNGTLSDDEPVLYSIYAELFAEQGKPLSPSDYADRLAGHSDEGIVARWLGASHSRIDELVARRVALYRERVADGSSIGATVRAAVHAAAERVPVGVVSGAARAEIEPVIRAAGLAGAISFVVAAGDVARGKPDPEGYLRALELIGRGVQAHQVLVFEDTEAGLEAAKGAGMRVVGITRTLGAGRMARADALAESIDLELVRRLLDEADRP